MKTCKHKKILLGTTWVETIKPDQEPYKAGKIEPHEDIEDVSRQLNVHYCERCQRILDATPV